MEGPQSALLLQEAARLASEVQELLQQELQRAPADRDEQLPSSRIQAAAAALLGSEVALCEHRLLELGCGPPDPQPVGNPPQSAQQAQPDSGGGGGGSAAAELEILERQLEVAAAKCAELERHKAAAEAKATEAEAAEAPAAALAATQRTAQRVAILAQKAHIERQELQLRLQRLKRSLSTAAATAGQAAAAASHAAASQHVQQLAGTATGSVIVAAERRLDKPVHVE
ncbi:hypothetical protein COHA_002773 [Chlorella ohadii]|uniref:Uncharacterized protein n=1 Tax=Chlorella ohadii TaxID=2649997 RepID=A0AAD5H4H5_9CHLO|nr:hypothetical protein COHA_002773 [Chlorella ohadii]